MIMNRVCPSSYDNRNSYPSGGDISSINQYYRYRNITGSARQKKSHHLLMTTTHQHHRRFLDLSEDDNSNHQQKKSSLLIDYSTSKAKTECTKNNDYIGNVLCNGKTVASINDGSFHRPIKGDISRSSIRSLDEFFLDDDDDDEDRRYDRIRYGYKGSGGRRQHQSHHRERIESQSIRDMLQHHRHNVYIVNTDNSTSGTDNTIITEDKENDSSSCSSNDDTSKAQFSLKVRKNKIHSRKYDDNRQNHLRRRRRSSRLESTMVVVQDDSDDIDDIEYGYGNDDHKVNSYHRCIGSKNKERRRNSSFETMHRFKSKMNQRSSI